MAIPDGVTKLTVSGTLASGVERFAFSLYFTGYPQYPASGYFDANGLDLSTSWVAFRDKVLALNRPDMAITAYDVYYYMGGVAVSHQSAVVNHPGITNGTNMPLQMACVLTLRSALSTRSGRGRIYLPATAQPLQTANYLMTAAPVNACVDALATWFTFIKSVSPLAAVVVSQTHSNTQPIVSVDANLVPDTQRRRANRLTSSRHSANV